MAISATFDASMERLMQAFPFFVGDIPMSRNVFILPDKSASVVLERKSTLVHGRKESSIYSLIAQDCKALREIMRVVVKDTDNCGEKLSINLVKNRLSYEDIEVLMKEFQFEQLMFNRQCLVRQVYNLSEYAYEVLPAIETDDKITIVNKESEGNCFLARNIYCENLAVFPSRGDAEVYLNINR